jgi:serine/threonine protein kinase
MQTERCLNGRYQLQSSLGQNAGRQTWLAIDLDGDSPTPAIIKLLAFSPQMSWDEFKLFEREAQVLESLEHSRIPKYRDYFSLDREVGEGLCWFGLVQDYIPGKSLQQLLDEGVRLSEVQVRSIATQILEILIYLHDLNPPILHRDIKPSNLILDDLERVYLVDFGAVGDPTLVEGKTFTVVGTAGYAPLEQFWGKAVPASDLYALGATLIHLLTGISPADLPQHDLRVEFRDRVSLDRHFLEWIETLTNPDLNQRFSSATQALDALQSENFARIVEKPKDSQVQMMRSSDKLMIQIPQSRISRFESMKYVVHSCVALVVFIVLYFPILVGGVVSIELVRSLIIDLKFTQLTALQYYVLFLGFILFFSIWYWRQASLPFHRLAERLKRHTIACFGCDRLELSRTKLKLCRQVGFLKRVAEIEPLAEIHTIESLPIEGIAIDTDSQRYQFGKNLTEAEQDWLIWEIQDWRRNLTINY